MSAIGLEGFFWNTKKRYGTMLVVLFQKKKKKGTKEKGVEIYLDRGLV